MKTYFNRAVLYIRTSTKRQSIEKIFSPEQQQKVLREYAEKNGWIIEHEFIENDSAFFEGMTRPELNKIRALSQQQQLIDAIIFYDLSRFTRDVADAILLYREFTDRQVRIISMTEGEVTDDNQLVYIFTSYQNQEWVKKNREKSMLGFRGKVESGIYHGNRTSPYGYTVEGKRKQTRLIPRDDQAKIVRLIFTMYAIDGYTVTQIAEHLTANRIPTPGELAGYIRKRGKGEWSFDSVKKVIRNEIYGGIAWAYKTQKIGGKTVLRPKNEWIAIEVPAIVPRGLFDLAQSKMDEGKINSPRNKFREYLAGSRVTCGICESSMAGTYSAKGDIKYYRCNSGRSTRFGNKCSAPHYRADMVDVAIWQFVSDLIEDPRVVMQGYKHMQQEMLQRTAHLQQQIQDIDNEMERRKEQVERLLELYTVGSIPKDMLVRHADEFKRISDDLRTRQEVLQRELDANTISDEELEYLIGTIEQYKTDLQDNWTEADFQTQRSLIEALGLFFSLAIENEPVLYIKWMTNRFRIVMRSGSEDTNMSNHPLKHITTWRIKASKTITFKIPLNTTRINFP